MNETIISSRSMSLLEFTMITFDHMIDRGLDTLENSNNSMVQYMNRRVDEIQDEIKQSMEEFYLMQFASMSVLFPLVAISLFMFGGSPILTGMLAMGGPMYLMNFMIDKSIEEARRFLS